MLVFLVKKNQNLLDIQEHCIRKRGKIRSELKLIWCLLLIFKVVYRDHLTQLIPFAWDFVVNGQRLVWGQVRYPKRLQKRNNNWCGRLSICTSGHLY